MGMKEARADNVSPKALDKVLVRHPKLRLYVMHAGYPMLEEMLLLMYMHPRVYVDLGAINWSRPQAEFHHYLQRLVEAVDSGRSSPLFRSERSSTKTRTDSCACSKRSRSLSPGNVVQRRHRTRIARLVSKSNDLDVRCGSDVGRCEPG
jgi:Amidohydrolase